MKTRTITIEKEPRLNISAEAYDTMSQEEFRDHIGGILSVALFKGKFEDALWNALLAAQARGARMHHSNLWEQAKQSKQSKQAATE